MIICMILNLVSSRIEINGLTYKGRTKFAFEWVDLLSSKAIGCTYQEFGMALRIRISKGHPHEVRRVLHLSSLLRE